jgi:hypothetical protein
MPEAGGGGEGGAKKLCPVDPIHEPWRTPPPHPTKTNTHTHTHLQCGLQSVVVWQQVSVGAQSSKIGLQGLGRLRGTLVQLLEGGPLWDVPHGRTGIKEVLACGAGGGGGASSSSNDSSS